MIDSTVLHTCISANLLTEVYEKFSVSFTLVMWQSCYTGHIVFLLTMLLFTEISHKVTASVIISCQHIEQKRLHVIV